MTGAYAHWQAKIWKNSLSVAYFGFVCFIWPSLDDSDDICDLKWHINVPGISNRLLRYWYITYGAARLKKQFFFFFFPDASRDCKRSAVRISVHPDFRSILYAVPCIRLVWFATYVYTPFVAIRVCVTGLLRALNKLASPCDLPLMCIGFLFQSCVWCWVVSESKSRLLPAVSVTQSTAIISFGWYR